MKCRHRHRVPAARVSRVGHRHARGQPYGKEQAQARGIRRALHHGEQRHCFGIDREALVSESVNDSGYENGGRLEYSLLVIRSRGRFRAPRRSNRGHILIRHYITLQLCTTLVAGLVLPAAAHKWFADDEPPLLTLGVGTPEIFDGGHGVFWTVEYRPAFRFHHIGPWFFVGTGKNNEFYAALGLLMNIELGRGWVLTPAFGGGYYKASGGLDLGLDAEFRSSLELARRFTNGHRVGICLSHLSNGALSDRNPGTETIGIVYSIPLGFLSRIGQSKP